MWSIGCLSVGTSTLWRGLISLTLTCVLDATGLGSRHVTSSHDLSLEVVHALAVIRLVRTGWESKVGWSKSLLPALKTPHKRALSLDSSKEQRRQSEAGPGWTSPAVDRSWRESRRESRIAGVVRGLCGSDTNGSMGLLTGLRKSV
jgi:hypothetical protein